MADEKSPVPEKFFEDNIRQILARYESRARSFENSFKILLLFSILFFFVIQIPFITIQVKKENLDHEIKNISSEVELSSRAVNTFKNAQDGIELLHSAIKGSPVKLRDYIRDINNRSLNNIGDYSSNQLNAPPYAQMSNTGDVSQHTPDTTDLKTKVKEEVERYFKDYQQILFNKVITPLDSLDVKNLKGFIGDLDSLQILMQKNYEENPDFWQTFEGKGGFYNKLDEHVNIFLGRFTDNLYAQKSELDKRLENLNGKIDSLNNLSAQQKETEKQITARMEQIEFPFGKVPIGLSESIAVFPLLVTIGLIFSISLFVETIRLRKNLHNLYLQKDPQKEVFTDMQISLIAPLWIDPLQSNKNQKMKFLMLSVPFIILLISVGIIIYTWMLPGSSILAASDTWWIYIFLYLLSLYLCFFNFRKVFGELSDYNKS